MTYNYNYNLSFSNFTGPAETKGRGGVSDGSAITTGNLATVTANDDHNAADADDSASNVVQVGLLYETGDPGCSATSASCAIMFVKLPSSVL